MTNITTTLESLAAEASAYHDIACGKAGEALEAARLSGERLIEAKRLVGHGGWLPWVAANFRASARTATGYMRLAEGWTAIQSKSEATSDLTIAGALRLLAAPPPEKAPPASPSDPWLASDPATRGRHCTLWPSTRLSEVLMLDCCGWHEAQIAGFLGVDIALVVVVLQPSMPVYTQMQELDRTTAEWVPKLAAGAVDRLLGAAWEHVRWRAPRDPRVAPDDAQRIEGCHRLAVRRMHRAQDDEVHAASLFEPRWFAAMTLYAWDVARGVLRISDMDPPLNRCPCLALSDWWGVIERVEAMTDIERETTWRGEVTA